MKAPRSHIEVQRLAGCLVALNRFISRLEDRNLPFFRKLRQASKDEFTWDEEYAQTFEELKDYLSNPKGSDAGILIQGPEGLQLEYALRFSFKTTNNEAEYEAMVAGLLLAQSLNITWMVVRGDSKMVIEQIRGDCGVKSESLQKYYAKTTSLTTKFDYLVFKHIPRQENEHANHLSRLATTYYEDIPMGVDIEHREKPIHEEIRACPRGQEEKIREDPSSSSWLQGSYPKTKLKPGNCRVGAINSKYSKTNYTKSRSWNS
ncbi:hypothetical protein LIER_00231 [Lithospermum erythrorhizon]|uniref:RNase H type-1 domain-containing protein n=1 Tax=Lithospermum erythrorhizon TaxID=34254 RepID=A0AAV3NHS5_LITER